MGILGNAVSQLLGFGLQQADDLIGRKVEEGQLAEAAAMTRQLLEQGEANINNILSQEGLEPVAQRTAEEFDAFQQFLEKERDPNVRLQMVRDFQGGGSFGLAKRSLDTRDARIGEADKTAFSLIEKGIGTERGSNIGGQLGLDAGNVRSQQTEVFKEQERFKTDENVRETREESSIPGRVSRGGGGSPKSSRTKISSSIIKDSILQSGNPELVNTPSKGEVLAGVKPSLTKQGTKVLVDIQTRKTFDSQMDAASGFGLDIGVGSSEESTPQQEIEQVQEETTQKVEAQVFKSVEEADGNLTAMASILTNSPDEKLDANIARAETILKRAGKASKAAKANFQKIMAQAKQRRNKRKKR